MPGKTCQMLRCLLSRKFQRMQNYLFIKTGVRCIKVDFLDIQYFEGSRRYTKIVTVKRNFIICSSLSRISSVLPESIFFRIHRSYIISLHHTSYFEKGVVFVAGKQLPIGRRYRGTLLKRVTLLCGYTENETAIVRNDINGLIKTEK